MGMIVLAIVCGIVANELFAWGPRLSDLLLKLAVNRMSPKLQERMREEWQAHLSALRGGLSKLSAAAGFLLSTFWGFRRYREDEIDERIALAVGVALEEERERIRSALEAADREIKVELAARQLALEKKVAYTEKSWRENRTQLVKRRTHTRSFARLPPNLYKTTRHKGRPEFRPF